MLNKKIARTYRLEPDVIKKIEVLQNLFSDTLGVKVSQADTIKIIVNEQWNIYDKKRLEEFTNV